MKAAEIKVYEIFKQRFSEQEAEAVIEYFEAKSEEKINIKKDIFLTKDDKVEMVSMIKDSRNEIIKWMFIFWIGQLAAMFAFVKILNH